MCPKALRPPLAAILIAFSMISLLPASFASASQSSPPQSASSRPKRGKNGYIVADGSAQKKPAPVVQSSSQGSKPAAREAAVPTRTNTRPQSTTPTLTPNSSGTATNDAGQRPVATQQRRDPPPFDRPPLTAGGNSPQSSQARTSQPSARPQAGGSSPSTYPQTQGGRPRVEQRQEQNTDSPDRDRGRATPPELGGYDQQNRREKDKPILRRPSDPPSRPEEQDDAPGPIASSRSGSSAPPDTGDDTIKLDATLVNIPILVSDRSGRYIPQLNQNDFLLYEDGVQQEIAFFGDEQVPFNVALLLDVSPSVQGSLEEIQKAALEFVRQLRSDDRVMIVSFDKDVHYHTGFSNNKRELESAIRNTETGSGTSVYDAVYEVVAEKLRAIEGRKALILLSDGEDTTSSHASYDEAINIVTESDVLVYGLRYDSGGGNVTVSPWPRNRIPQIPIPLPWPWPFPRRRRGGTFVDPNSMRMNSAPTSTSIPQSRGRRGRQGDFMEDLATAGGGPVYDADNISDLSRLAARVAEELRHVYQISYYPTNSLTNGGHRSIRVRVRGRDDIAVRHRRGYNARDVSGRPTT